MKRLFTIIFLASAISAAFAQSKNHNEDFQIPNGGMENWYNVVINPALNYDDLGTGPTDNWLGTLNSLAAVPQTAGGPGPVTVFKVTDNHSGTYAAKVVSANFPLGPVTIFIPGMIGTAVLNNQAVSAILGKPCADCKPSRLRGYYKFEQVNGDSCVALILLSKWNSSAKKRDTIGYGKMVQHTPVSTYTEFDVPVNYISNGSVDTMTVLVVASAGLNVVEFTQSQGQPGNTIYVDDLRVDYPSGIQQMLMPEVNVTVYPNPAADVLHIALSKEVKDGTFKVYDAAGKQVGSFRTTQKDNNIGVSGLTSGSYYFRLTSGNDVLNTGTFVINK